MRTATWADQMMLLLSFLISPANASAGRGRDRAVDGDESMNSRSPPVKNGFHRNLAPRIFLGKIRRSKSLQPLGKAEYQIQHHADKYRSDGHHQKSIVGILQWDTANVDPQQPG